VLSEPKTKSGRRREALDPTTIAILRRPRVRQSERRLAGGGKSGRRPTS
jgi:hypothetical protein